MPPSPLDLVGLGALNIDYIVPTATMDPKKKARLIESVTDGERSTDDWVEFLETLARVRDAADRVVVTWGGSAFNTIRAAAEMRSGLRLGYMAPLGRLDHVPLQPDGKLETLLRSLGIDDEGFVRCEGRVGASISLVERGKRELQTYYDPSLLSEFVARADDIAPYLARARHVHVTSLFGDDAPTSVASILLAARRLGEFDCSVDPGSVWVRDAEAADGGLQQLLGLADLLFLNSDELRSLGSPASDEGHAAERVFARYLDQRRTLVVHKDWDRLTLFRRDVANVVKADRVEQQVLPLSAVADSTGAGDVVAGGFLVGLLSEVGRNAAAAHLGLEAARERLQGLGDAGYRRLASVLEWRPPERRSVFISHATVDSGIARALVTLLENVGVSDVFCSSVSDAGIPVGGHTIPEIRDALVRSALVIELISPAFLDSAFCRYEIGAAWALRREVFPLALPPVDPDQLDDLLRGRWTVGLPQASSAHALLDCLTRMRIVEGAGAERWARHVDDFLAAIRGQL